MADNLNNDFDEGDLDFSELYDPLDSVEDQYKKGIFRVVYQANNFFMPQLLEMIKSKEILNIRPEYQRRLKWDNKRKSLLIESLLLNIPIPPLFFYERDMASYEVMDGQQRINAIREFYNNEFKLTGLTVLEKLNGLSYKNLHPVLLKGLNRASLSVNILLLESEEKEKDPQKIRRYVFERLNTGGRRLNDQEIRNCIYAGSFNDMINDLTRERMFTQAWDIPDYDPVEGYESPERKRNSLYKNMYDCQLVLRFFALKDQDNIVGSMKSILDRTMRKNKDLDNVLIDAIKAEFLLCLKTAVMIFGTRPFRIKTATGEFKNSAPLFDAIMVSICKYKQFAEVLVKNKELIRVELDRLIKDNVSYSTLVGKGNTAQAIKDRIKLISDILSANCK